MPNSGSSAYDIARGVLDAAKEEAFAKLKAESSKRWRIVGGAAAAWLVVSVVLVMLVGNDMLLAAVLGFAVIVMVGVFYLIPTAMGKSGMHDVFDQYAAQLDRLEKAGADLPVCASMEELVPAIDFVSSVDSSERESSSTDEV